MIGCLTLALGVGAGTGDAARPVKIDKTRTSFKEWRFASAPCDVAPVGPGGVIYETEGCHRPLYVIGLQAFQVRVPRSTSVDFSGVVNAQGCNRFIEIDMKVILLVDGKRIRTTEVHVPRSKRPADFVATTLARIPKGRHSVEVAIQPTEEEGLSGLCVNEATLSVTAG